MSDLPRPCMSYSWCVGCRQGNPTVRRLLRERYAIEPEPCPWPEKQPQDPRRQRPAAPAAAAPALRPCPEAPRCRHMGEAIEAPDPLRPCRGARVRCLHSDNLSGQWWSGWCKPAKCKFYEEASVIRDLQVLSFEIGDTCNLSAAHPWCPSNRPERYADASTPPAEVPQFLAWLDTVMAQGFRGYVAAHYFNEPTLCPERARALAAGAHARGLQTLLWTNGLHAPEPGVWDRVLQTAYGEVRPEAAATPFAPDDRGQVYETDPVGRGDCYRPTRLEMVVNYYGDLRLCCADWAGAERIGNIATTPHDELVRRWVEAAVQAQACGLDVCRRCQALRHSPALHNAEYRL